MNRCEHHQNGHRPHRADDVDVEHRELDYDDAPDSHRQDGLGNLTASGSRVVVGRPGLDNTGSDKRDERRGHPCIQLEIVAS